MPERNDLQLQINNTIYQGWESVSVRRSLDYFADSFDLTLTDNQAGQARTIKLGSPCVVKTGGETLITGYIDLIRPRYDGKKRTLAVSGRSKTADLVDCSLPPTDKASGQRQKQTILQLAGDICAHFGITVRCTEQCEPIRVSAMTAEQTAFDFLELHARMAGVRLVSDPQGNLLITRAGKKKVNTALVLGENIQAAAAEFNGRERFSLYYFTGQRGGTDTTYGGSAAHITGRAEDNNMPRYRPTSIIAEGALDGSGMAKRRAEWQRNVQYGRSRRAVYTVSGWRHKDGLWEPNTRVLVVDDWVGFTGEDGQGEWLMIGTVEYIYDGRGKRTRLTVMPAEAYDLVPLPAADQGEF